MRLEKGEYTISFNYKELQEIVYAILHDLKYSIESHYNKLQQEQDGEEVFHKFCDTKIAIMNELFSLIGHSHMIEQSKYDFKHMFESKRKERKKEVDDELV